MVLLGGVMEADFSSNKRKPLHDIEGVECFGVVFTNTCVCTSEPKRARLPEMGTVIQLLNGISPLRK